jgi:hypothetical protein
MQIQSTYLKKNFASQKFGEIGLKSFVVRFLFYFVLFDNFFSKPQTELGLKTLIASGKKDIKSKEKNKVSKKLKLLF